MRSPDPAAPVERGQSTILLVGVVTVVVAIAGALVSLAAVGIERGRVQAVADLTALATARSDADGASVARRNGAHVVSIERDGSVVTVVVDRDGTRAVATAES